MSLVKERKKWKLFLKLAACLIVCMSCFIWLQHRATQNHTHNHLIGRKLSLDQFRHYPKKKTAHVNSSNIVLLAYQRSGSSFLGELMSSHPASFYLFEPSMELINGRNFSDASDAAQHLRRIFNCEPSVFRMFDDQVAGPKNIDFFFPKLVPNLKRRRLSLNVTRHCEEARVRVVKTIRYRMDAVLELMKHDDTNVKIVHLVRDPRAVLNSINGHECWNATMRDPEYQCSSVRTDLRLSSQLPASKYFRIRYEDIMSNTLNTAIKLFRFLEIPIHDSLATYIVSHTKTEQFSTGHTKPVDYFSTFKRSGFDPDHWRRSLPLKQLESVERHCADIISLLGYS